MTSQSSTPSTLLNGRRLLEPDCCCRLRPGGAGIRSTLKDQGQRCSRRHDGQNFFTPHGVRSFGSHFVQVVTPLQQKVGRYTTETGDVGFTSANTHTHSKHLVTRGQGINYHKFITLQQNWEQFTGKEESKSYCTRKYALIHT